MQYFSVVLGWFFVVCGGFLNNGVGDIVGVGGGDSVGDCG